MAREKTPEENAADNERKQLVEEKKNLKKEQQAQRKEAKRRAREIAKQEDELEDGNEGNSLLTFGATILIVALWLAVICVIIKLDIGGFGSSVVTPILKDVPVLNRILPGNSVTETTNSGAYGGYTSLQDAVDQIKSLELQLEQIQNASSAKDEELDQLKAEVLRLKEFENQQVEFQRIQKEFYDEVVYSDKGPGAEEYKKYYESMDPATAEYIYKQVVTQLQESQEVQDYAAAYSAMKPKQAAAIFEQMTNNLDLAARILKVMSADDRGAILGAMNSEVAAKIRHARRPQLCPDIFDVLCHGGVVRSAVNTKNRFVNLLLGKGLSGVQRQILADGILRAGQRQHCALHRRAPGGQVKGHAAAHHPVCRGAALPPQMRRYPRPQLSHPEGLG